MKFAPPFAFPAPAAYLSTIGSLTIGSLTMGSMTKLLLATLGLATTMLVGMPASQAGTIGNAPWCAVQDLGAGDVVWDCEYQTVAQCQPEVIAGNRGFCNVNPRWTPPVAAPRRYRHHHT